MVGDGPGRTVADFTDVIWINTSSGERQFPFSRHSAVFASSKNSRSYRLALYIRTRIDPVCRARLGDAVRRRWLQS